LDITIAQFTMDHYDDVYGLWEQSEGIGLSDADARENIQSYFGRNPGMSFVAVMEDSIVGAVLAGHDGRRGYIHHLVVQPAFRGQGTGRRLVGRCLSALEAAGIQKCHGFIFDDNAEGGEFWKRIGWRLRTDLRLISKTIT
jgi:N-acetylglutamate synthase